MKARRKPAEKKKGKNRFSVIRFDPVHEPRIKNTSRQTPPRSILPVDFPMVFDLEANEVVEPILVHLHAKFFSAGAIVKGQWVKLQSADSAAEDLRMWWEYLHSTRRAWDQVTDAALATYLTILNEELSSATLDHLGSSTIRGRRSSIGEFYRFAVARWSLTTFPTLENATLLSGSHPLAKRSRARFEAAETEPRPFDQDKVDAIADALGPLPSVWQGAKHPSSRSRLAFEIALNVGLRIDEIENLTASMFSGVPLRHDAWDVPFYLKIRKTKGLVSRTVEFPQWLLEEIQIYIGEGGEREASLAQGHRIWLRDERMAPVNLLLNQPRGDDAGKRSRAPTIENDFHVAMVKLNLVTRQPVAKGTPDERTEDQPRHTFHDCRHTYALWQYNSVLGIQQNERGRIAILGGVADYAVRHVQRLLGHADPETTKSIYLNVFEKVAEEVAELIQREFRSIRQSRDEGASA